MNEQEIIRKIESYGDDYCRDYLEEWDDEVLSTNWWEALKFFFAHSFMRGRQDTLSNEYYYFAVSILKDYFSINGDLDICYSQLKSFREYYGKRWLLNFKKGKK